ncbi:hypothetical protein EDC96DRAFT_548262 [Choanephora cucurbitarum]|nr:hypothetical protein EDC96DRAFT_548262 [Choanephora cucurbitarum]
MAYVTKHYHGSNSAEYSVIDKTYLGYSSYDGAVVKATFNVTVLSLNKIYSSFPYFHYTIDVTSYIMLRRFFLNSNITKYISFDTTVSNLKSQQQICIFNLELASFFSAIPDKSTSWGYWPSLF